MFIVTTLIVFLSRRDIEQKSEENKQLEQNIRYLKKDLKETQLALKYVIIVCWYAL